MSTKLTDFAVDTINGHFGQCYVRGFYGENVVCTVTTGCRQIRSIAVRTRKEIESIRDLNRVVTRTGA